MNNFIFASGDVNALHPKTIGRRYMMNDKYENKPVINPEDIAVVNVGTPGHIEHNIKVCPHCGSINAPTVMDDVEFHGTAEVEESITGFIVVCDASSKNRVSGCGATGGFDRTAEKAIERWNKRDAKEVDTTEALRLMSELKEVLSTGALFQVLTLKER